jgi:hypothetical protein
LIGIYITKEKGGIINATQNVRDEFKEAEISFMFSGPIIRIAPSIF